MQFFLYEYVLVILYKKYLLLFSKYLLTRFYVFIAVSSDFSIYEDVLVNLYKKISAGFANIFMKSIP